MYLLYRKEYQKEKVWFIPVKNSKTTDLSDIDTKSKKFYAHIKTNTQLVKKDIKKYLPDKFIKKFGVVLVTKS
jgi:hypothetical protein